MSKYYTFKSLYKTPILLGERADSEATVSKVVIPRIQRPYAQGRSVPESEKVRNDFLDEIFSVLRGENETLDLNFIYGKVEERMDNGQATYVMQLLDGQQRFTTLFLLHWYLFNRENVPDNEESHSDILRALGSFSYETRDSSSKFCELLSELAAHGRKLKFFEKDKDGQDVEVAPKKSIRSALGYVHVFDLDPTVGAMLTMLDAINGKYNEHCPKGECREYWRRVDQIRFFVLPLTRYKLSEELYIKMNARGLPLSPFDCFKADFLGLMDLPRVQARTTRLVNLATGRDTTADDKDAVTFKQYFATHLDSYWCDLFWRTRDPESYDPAYMLFFSRYFAARFFIEHKDDITGKEWRENKTLDIHFFHGKHEDDKIHYHGIRPFSRMVETYGGRIGYFDDLMNLLNLFSTRRNEVLSAMKPIWDNSGALNDYFCDGSIKLTQIQLVIISAVIEFAHCFPSFSIDIFRAWMKSVNCIVENTNIDGYTPAAATAGKLAFLIDSIASKKPETVAAFYQSMAEVPKADIGAAAIEEEIEKAKRITEKSTTAQKPDNESMDAWANVFDDVARHPFLKGMIGFYYDSTMDCEAFSRHVALISSLFAEDGISTPYREPQHLLLRAVMAQLTAVDLRKGKEWYIVEGNVKKYLKNILASLNDNELRIRIHELFASRLLGKVPAAEGQTSAEVLDALRQAINDAPQVAANVQWNVREAIRVLREDVGLYKWILSQNEPVRIYWHCNQLMARVPKKWACVMASVFRPAQKLAEETQMAMSPNNDGRNGYDAAFEMLVGQEYWLKKELQNFADIVVCVRFYASNEMECPVELSLRWPKGKMDLDHEKQVCDRFGGDEVGSFGDEHYCRLGTWNFSLGTDDQKTISLQTLKTRVETIVAQTLQDGN